jgi:tRNA(fMet)-specific endonuclease VapC
MRYLLDTNIIIFWLKGRYNIGEKIRDVGANNCYVSEVTVAELRFGVECSDASLLAEKRRRLEFFLKHLQIIPFSIAIEQYAKEKARLRSKGEIISDFDLLIGATAIQKNLICVTNNTKHLSRIKNIILEDWTQHVNPE